MDFNRAEATCFITYFPSASSRKQNGAYSTTRSALYVHPRLDSILELCRALPIELMGEYQPNMQ